jgi:hypothetical protein
MMNSASQHTCTHTKPVFSQSTECDFEYGLWNKYGNNVDKCMIMCSRAGAKHRRAWPVRDSVGMAPMQPSYQLPPHCPELNQQSLSLSSLSG